MTVNGDAAGKLVVASSFGCEALVRDADPTA
jgi:hypothetical protein